MVQLAGEKEKTNDTLNKTLVDRYILGEVEERRGCWDGCSRFGGDNKEQVLARAPRYYGHSWHVPEGRESC